MIQRTHYQDGPYQLLAAEQPSNAFLALKADLQRPGVSVAPLRENSISLALGTQPPQFIVYDRIGEDGEFTDLLDLIQRWSKSASDPRA